MAQVLLSYKTEGRTAPGAIAAQLAKAGLGIDLVTRASDETSTEADIEANETAIDAAECVVTLWSRASSASNDVLLEAQRAMSQRKLVLSELQSAALPPTLAGQQLIDVSTWLLTRGAKDL